MLTATKLNSLKPKDKTYRLSDGNGLFIEVRANGSKYWRQAYRYNGKQKTLAHGVYPLVSLADARELRDTALKNKLDPSKAKRQEKAQLSNTFELVAKVRY